MGKLNAFIFMTLDGYFEGPAKGDISWHRHGLEESDFAIDMLQSGNTLLFGRITYGHMASYWPTPDAIKNAPALANGMNEAEKIVFSQTMKKAEWNNTRLIKDNIADEIKKLKQSGKNMTILGSGSILTQLADHGLIDEYQFMVDPVAIGEGNSIFKGVKRRLNLELSATRTFKSGVVLLSYYPMK